MRPHFVLAGALLALWVPSAAAADGDWLARLPGPTAARELHDEDARVREAAAVALGRRGASRPAVLALLEALPGERNADVRRAIFASLARRGDAAAVRPLARLLSESTADDAEAATIAGAIGAIPDRSARQALVVALGQPALATAARAGLRRAGPEVATALLRVVARTSASPEAIRALGDTRDPRALGAIQPALARDDPDVRIAALAALADLGDPRAARVVAERLADRTASVRLEAIVTLGRIGGPEQGPALANLAAPSEAVEVRRAALRALALVDPARAIPVLEAALAAGDVETRRIAEDAALGMRHPAAIGLLRGMLRVPELAEAAATALAAIDGDDGLRALERDASGSSAAARGLAIALRRADASSGEGGERTRRWRLVREHAAPADVERTLVFRALARDPWVAPHAIEALRSPRAARRAAAALALELAAPSIDDGAALSALRTALAAETDREAFRRQAAALVALGGGSPVDSVARWLADSETAPEALAVVATSLSEDASAGDSGREDLAAAAVHERGRRRLREALRAPEARVRAGAALALAVAHDHEAWRALATTLDDPIPEVRLAAARALAVLAVPESHDALAARARTEEDPRVLAACDIALDRGPIASEVTPRRVEPYARGSEVLRVRIAAADLDPAGIPVDVVLPDGRWLRYLTLADGDLVVPDLPTTEADVRVGLARP